MAASAILRNNPSGVLMGLGVLFKGEDYYIVGRIYLPQGTKSRLPFMLRNYVVYIIHNKYIHDKAW
jgi:hypothetical protein